MAEMKTKEGLVVGLIETKPNDKTSDTDKTSDSTHKGRRG